MQTIPPPNPWYSFEMRVKDRLVRQLESRLRWYNAKRWYTCLLHGPGGLIRRTVTATRRITRQRVLVSYPEQPSPDYELFKICAVLNLKLTSDLKAKADGIIYFHDLTHHEPDAAMQTLAKDRSVINFQCRDVSK